MDGRAEQERRTLTCLASQLGNQKCSHLVGVAVKLLIAGRAWVRLIMAVVAATRSDVGRAAHLATNSVDVDAVEVEGQSDEAGARSTDQAGRGSRSDKTRESGNEDDSLDHFDRV